ncbi:MAG: MaoC family dehydratase [Rhodobacteraceae bacterium]|nr:MaoC family dehydratase [Paracoccaceae bacterium]
MAAQSKSRKGNYFEDFELGRRFHHPTPRTLSEGDVALYNAIYPCKHSIFCSSEFARQCGLERSPVEDLAVFHVVFGKTVPDISTNAVANLGYAECHFHRPAFVHDTLRAETEVIGLRETSSRKAGIVWVRSKGFNQRDETVLEFVRWVLVRKRDPQSPSQEPFIPDLNAFVPAAQLPARSELDFSGYGFQMAGEPWRLSDYEEGEAIDHVDALTILEAEHVLATRLWQNPARVHFDVSAATGGRRLIYGGHVMSTARALSHNGLANAQVLLAINGGSHSSPCHAGDTLRASSRVLSRADHPVAGAGAIRLQTIAYKAELDDPWNRHDDGHPDVVLSIDYWCLIPE